VHSAISPVGGTLGRMNDRSDIAELDASLARVVDRDLVAAVQVAMPDTRRVEQVADVFALLGDPNRVRLLVALLEAGEMCVCDLAAAAGMTESAASHAVRWLRAHRIVSSPRREGRMMYYRLDDAHVRVLLDIALSHAQHTLAMHPERDGA
jgi:ArsR family transcriptional regulator, lead/cadmium/zinc/bismuth-responsive transcriptional repressor